MHLAWRGRGSPVPLEHDGGLESFLLSSVEGRHRPLPRGYHHDTFRRVTSLLCVLFLRRAAGSWAAGGLRCVTWPRGQGAWCQTRRLGKDEGGVHHFHPIYDRPAELRSQIEAGRHFRDVIRVPEIHQ